MGDQVGRAAQYELFADEFRRHARDGFHNAHCDRPMCLGLLGEVAGRTVLDAACGPGLGGSFDVRVIDEVWSKGWAVRYWLAPLQQTCEELFQAGFLIERLLERTPTARMAETPDGRRLSREPVGFLGLRALRRD